MKRYLFFCFYLLGLLSYVPADMKDLKIRTMEIPLHMKIVTDLGGRAVQLPDLRYMRHLNPEL